mgnify:CR=1 FL=1
MDLNEIKRLIQLVQKSGIGELASTTEEWVASLSGLLTDVERRRRLGEAGRKVVEQRYSVAANWPTWRDAVLGMSPPV